MAWGEAGFVPDSLAPVPTLLTSTVSGKNEDIKETRSQYEVNIYLIFKWERTF
jgi:hypothetical protein